MLNSDYFLVLIIKKDPYIVLIFSRFVLFPYQDKIFCNLYCRKLIGTRIGACIVNLVICDLTIGTYNSI